MSGVCEGLSGSRCMTVRQGGLEGGLTQFLIGGVFRQRGLVPMPNFTMKKYVRNENSCWSEVALCQTKCVVFLLFVCFYKMHLFIRNSIQ